MTLKQRKTAFVQLGDFLRQQADPSTADTDFNRIIQQAKQLNPWFTEANIRHALGALGNMLQKEKLDRWTDHYDIPDEPKSPKKVAIVMAGNIPLVGFHDFLSVLVSGHRVLAKLSSDDPKLMQAVAEKLIEIEPAFAERIELREGQIKGMEAVIATGSNNTSRYFEYYFGKYPNIIRKNRNSVAVITGEESDEELEKLGEDIFRYFGLGCRNVSKIYVPEGYDMVPLLEQFEQYKEIAQHHKYANNYDYNKSIFLVNKEPHLDTGFALFRKDRGISSPIACVYYETYDKPEHIKKEIDIRKDEIQCVVSSDQSLAENTVAPGKAQQPELWDYADGVDTLEFLVEKL